MLEEINWKKAGYGLFGVSVLAGANPTGERGAMNESCCLFLKRSLWNKIGGFNERFEGLGGGLGSLDLFRRLMLETKGEINVLGGEGCFHQIHGGISTSANPPRKDWEEEYLRLNGFAYHNPKVRPVLIESSCLNLPRWWTKFRGRFRNDLHKKEINFSL
jgi:hypothetical protein